jgi:hypothetical protein
MRQGWLAALLLFASACNAPPTASTSEALYRCNPDDIVTICIGSTIKTVCDGHVLSTEPCPQGCHEGQCGIICTDGSNRCDAGTLEICVSNQWELADNCPNGCDTTTGACLPCPTGGTACGDQFTLLTCVNQQWQATNCADGCNATYHDCNACQPGAAQCNGSDLQTCGSDGEWHTTSCPLSCANGACEVCTPGTRKCSSDVSGDDVERCNSNGQWVPVHIHCQCGLDLSACECNPVCGSGISGCC